MVSRLDVLLGAVDMNHTVRLAVLSMLPLALEDMMTRGYSLLRNSGTKALVTTRLEVTALFRTVFRFRLISPSSSDLGRLTPAALLMRTLEGTVSAWRRWGSLG